MDTTTGKIHMIPPGQAVPSHFVPLGRLPDPKCPICKGKGKTGPKVVGKKKNRRIVFVPCQCTEPQKPTPELPKAFGAFGEQPKPLVAVVGPGPATSHLAEVLSRTREDPPVIILP